MKFPCTNGVPYLTKVADSPTKNAYVLGVSHGITTSLDGQEGTGLLWVTDVQNINFKIYDKIPKERYIVPLDVGGSISFVLNRIRMTPSLYIIFSQLIDASDRL